MSTVKAGNNNRWWLPWAIGGALTVGVAGAAYWYTSKRCKSTAAGATAARSPAATTTSASNSIGQPNDAFDYSVELFSDPDRFFAVANSFWMRDDIPNHFQQACIFPPLSQ